MFHSEISGLQYAHALSTISGYRGYGAEQGNMVYRHYYFILLFAYLNDFVGVILGQVFQIFLFLSRSIY